MASSNLDRWRVGVGCAAAAALISIAIWVDPLGLRAPPASQPVVVAPPPPDPAVIAQGQWQAELVSHLESNKRYPSFARSFKEEGTVVLRFTVDRDGKVLNAQIDQSSGSLLLDEEALDMMDRAQPLPKFPPEMTIDQLELIIPMRYSLE